MHGRPWTGVAQILRSDIYIGVSTFGRFSTKLGSRQVRNDPSQWIRCEGAFEPLVREQTFRAAARTMARNRGRKTDADILDKLRALHLRLGRLSARDVLAEPDIPTPPTLARRFGSFKSACERAGYVRPIFPYTWVHPTLVHRACDLFEDNQMAIINAGGRADVTGSGQPILIDGKMSMGVTCCRPMRTKAHTSWRIHLTPGYGIDFLLVKLLGIPDDSLAGYALLPASRFGAPTIYISQSRDRPWNHRFASLAELYGLLLASAR